MPIAALPPNTVSAIGSNATLADPISLVKELVDNAIDGRASSISVEMSANTLDDIRVKDNGHGIPPDDRSMICSRHCTSKIANLDELRTIGGRSLGFRGVALASAAEMSGSLTISTRIEGEGTASEIKFNRQGQIASEKRISLPVGTTVRVERFLEPLPVRRQTIEKTTAKTLARIKRLLQSYAIARPQLRLLFKVLKAKSDKDNFKYPISHRINGSVNETLYRAAALDIVGKKVIDQCQWTSSSWSTSGEQIETALADSGARVSIGEAYTIEAMLVKSEWETPVFSNVGQYLSVDCRPVSCTRGIFKQIVSIYKSHLRALKAGSSDLRIVDPFLSLNILCPTSSYDVNVEPAKDDVLFTDSELVLGLIEKHFISIYGHPLPSLQKVAARPIPNRTQGIELMLARKTPSREQQPVATETRKDDATPILGKSPIYHKCYAENEANHVPLRPRQSQPNDHIIRKNGQYAISPEDVDITNADGLQDRASSSLHETPWPPESLAGHSLDASSDTVGRRSPSLKRPTWKASMYGDDEEDEEKGNASSPLAMPAVIDTEEEEDALHSVQVSNPWAFAKLHAPFRTPARLPQQHLEPEPNPQLPTPSRQLGDVGSDPEHHPATPSPFPYPLKARAKRKTGEIAAADPISLDRGRYGRSSLDTWVQKPFRGNHDPANDLSDDNDEHQDVRGPPDLPSAGPFVSARTLPMGTPLSDIPDASERPRKKVPQKLQQKSTANKPYVAPVHDLERVWFDTGDTPGGKRSRQTQPRPRKPTADELVLRDDEGERSIELESPERPIHPDLAEALDYENRKQLANQQHRESLRRGGVASNAPGISNDIPTSSPHKNRQRAAIAALHGPPFQPSTTTTPATPSDPAPAISSHDPRAYLIRTKSNSSPLTHSPRKLKRRKTALLPLETLHSSQYIGNLIHTIPTTFKFNHQLESHLHDSGHYQDDYIYSGIIAEACSVDSLSQQEVGSWEHTLKALVKTQYRIEGMSVEEEMEGELDVDLWKTFCSPSPASLET